VEAAADGDSASMVSFARPSIPTEWHIAQQVGAQEFVIVF
jgi:hypothetical protein